MFIKFKEYNKQFFWSLGNFKMIVRLQRPDNFPLLLCSPDVSRLIWSENLKILSVSKIMHNSQLILSSS